MHIDELFSLASGSEAFSVPENWAQGRTVFGGLSAALLYCAIKQRVKSDRVLRSLNTHFVGPLVTEQALTIEVDVLREGGNVTQAVAKAVQGDQVAVMAQASFGVARDSKVSISSSTELTFELPKKPKFIPQIPKVTPKFLRHVDLAIQQGSMPFTGSKTAETGGWMRFSEAPKQVTDAHLIALIDAWPPTVLQVLKWPAPASTMSWNLEFVHPHAPVAPTDWFAYSAHTRQAGDGYAHTEANIWDQQGELVALSRQVITVFK